MTVHELAGKPAPRSLLVNITRLMSAYHTREPDVSDPTQRVAFETSGARGPSLKNSFNEGHILAVSRVVCDCSKSKKIDGPRLRRNGYPCPFGGCFGKRPRCLRCKQCNSVRLLKDAREIGWEGNGSIQGRGSYSRVTQGWN
jgi:hypothetical protein